MFQLFPRWAATLDISTMHSLVVKFELTVHDCEHFLVQYVEERIHHVGQVGFAARVVRFQFDEKIGKHVRILLVDHTVRPLEHLVKVVLGFFQQIFEVL